MARLNDLQILITADQAFAAFEQAVVDATDRIDMGFRVFDPRTELASDAARVYGTTWADLICAKLDAGVRVSLRLTDFDPIVRPWMHAASWKTFSVFAGIREITKNPKLLDVRVLDHPARVGWGPRLALWPKVQSEISETCTALADMKAGERTEKLRTMPRFRPFLSLDDESDPSPLRQKAPALMPVTHHQKVAVIDDEMLYIGGLDLDMRRFDTPHHVVDAEETWHDVQLLMNEPQLALSARQHLERFEAETRGDRPMQAPPGLLRTLSQKRESEITALSPKVNETGIQDRHLELIEQSDRLIYLESQFLRDTVIVDALVARAQERPKLGLISLLPAAPMEVAFENGFGMDMQYGEYMQAQCIDRLVEAFGDRFVVVSPAQPRAAAGEGRGTLLGAPIVFVHSKVSVFDDAAAIVSSANLNGRSMCWDTELGIELDDPEQVAQVRAKVMGTWLPAENDAVMTEASPDTVRLWRELAQDNAERQPEDRRGFILPYDISAARDFGSNLPGIPAEMV